MGLVSDRTSAFSVLWLKDVADDRDVEISLDVRKNEHGALAKAEVNCTEEGGEKVGEITVKLRIRPGLSNCHQEVADKDAHIKEVMEVLRCAVGSEE
ncbi:hypothetical protein C0995_006213, partial [Termitomyces sp. Mi166